MRAVGLAQLRWLALNTNVIERSKKDEEQIQKRYELSENSRQQ
jgi:hypothetical protein